MKTIRKLLAASGIAMAGWLVVPVSYVANISAIVKS